MTSPVSAIEKPDRIWAYGNNRGSRVWTPMKPVIAGAHEEQEYVRADVHEAAARKAEALQRENAELREALQPFADQAETFDSYGNGNPIPDRLQPSFVDHTIGDLRRARALLGGENAGN